MSKSKGIMSENLKQEIAKELGVYEQVKKDFENGNRSCVVFPTGCGKSYIALKMIEDNPDKEILYVSPASVITLISVAPSMTCLLVRI